MKKRGSARAFGASARSTSRSTTRSRIRQLPQRPGAATTAPGAAVKEREVIVKRIKDNKWGKSADGKTITGPEGSRLTIYIQPNLIAMTGHPAFGDPVAHPWDERSACALLHDRNTALGQLH